MNKILKEKLYVVINDWMNNNCQTEDWPNIFVGDKTSKLMTKAAASVFDAVEEVQVYCEKEGYLKEV